MPGKMQETTIKSIKSICAFCQTPIKNESETVLCPSCNSPYHTDCWIENKGCAVYGCGEKLLGEDDISSLRESIINIEYMINRNQFSEAILEAKQLLRVERRSPELKNLYNKAVSLINNKINLMTSGDEAFEKKDYKAAEIYYKNVLKYTDEVEKNFVTTRLEIAQEKIPEQKRRKIYQNILIVVLIFAILAAIGYLGYYTFVLKEDREFSEIVKSDNATDLRSMESMLGKYENFLKNYGGGRNKEKALNKINQYSYQIANTYYKDDWKLALKYFSKIQGSLDEKEAKILYNNIYNVAFNDYKQKISNAKKLNASSKYSEGLNELNNAMLIISSFADKEIAIEKKILESNISILNKKISSLIKAKDLEREIKEQIDQMGNVKSSVNKNSKVIVARLFKLIEPNVFAGREVSSGNIIAIKSSNSDYSIGQLVNAECVADGRITFSADKGKEENVIMYIPVSESGELDKSDINYDEKYAINERLSNLKTQKAKIDSVLRLGLL